MKFRKTLLMLILMSLVELTFSQGTLHEYENAERFLPTKIEEFTENLWITPHWCEKGDKFWYKRELSDEKTFFIVDAKKGVKRELFNRKKLAKKLSRLFSKKIDQNKLPFDFIKLSNDCRTAKFTYKKREYKIDVRSCKVTEVEVSETKLSEVGISPDGKWVAFVKKYNLYIKSVDTDVEYALTFDGEKDDVYATPLPSSKLMVDQQTEEVKQDVDVIWSPDSKRLISYKMNKKKCGKMHLNQSIPREGVRSKNFSFYYPLPGDTIIPKATQYIFDISTRNSIKVKAEPITLLYYGSPWWGTWFDSNNNFYYRETARGFGNVKIQKVDYSSGTIKTVFAESSKTYVDPNIWTVNILGDGSDILLNSERDGWNHLYMIDGLTGKVKTQLTKGEWFMRNIEKLDKKAKKIYFAASGDDKSMNLYYRQLYSVNFDGSDMKQLTLENATHSFSFSPDNRYFVDTYSTTDREPVMVLKKSNNGEVIMELEKGSVDRLKATGWVAPEQFKAKARDGKTEIYGVIYRPSTFDSNKQYPVIEQIYTGPHNFFAPKSFWAFKSHAQAFAELGFIVVQIDGMGTGKRSREFHEKSYKNLKDGGLPDHIAALKQMAKVYPYMDLTRVGIYGFSAGGYDVVNAMLSYPEFYKVGISASANHDHRMDKTWWNELWMGYPVKEHYVEQSNLTHAHKLKGKLLLAHGELDNNVNPYCTVRMIDALMKANKDFDYLYVPNQFHFLYDSKYYVRKRWDYFVKHLLSVEPPKEYRIK